MEAGIDEAGRGPVVGPLVVGLVAAEDPASLDDLGVKDSKVLSHRRRTELDGLLRTRGLHVETLEVSAAELDARMERRSLNDIEVDLFADVARRVPASRYFLDACDVDAARFGRNFLLALGGDPPPLVVSEHRADATYALVSAASIVAKVRRDSAVAEIASRLEPKVGLPLGSGYSHDVVTRAFLKRHLELFGMLPPDARAAWATSQTLTGQRWQRRLETFEAPRRS